MVSYIWIIEAGPGANDFLEMGECTQRKQWLRERPLVQLPASSFQEAGLLNELVVYTGITSSEGQRRPTILGKEREENLTRLGICF